MMRSVPTLLPVIVLVTSGVLYTVLCVAFLYEPAAEFLLGGTPPWLMRLLAPPIISVVGPAMWFVWGRDWWPVVVATATSSWVCLALAWRWRQRGPGVVAVTVTAATLLWVGSAWLAVAMGI